ncbi:MULTISPECIES: hypothetical protein [Moorena]|uniref:Uncharacterized protein n=1 Tax=Moorena producens 3L TaxID=489825 RepID=F4XL47_9CYAN|nr:MULTISPECIES: hypothetical protein [Moorena]NES86041.1 hypothetical protein [Moorena sp. SIO2B7]EGJ34737.1 hypothetical protein LYNGBM3L_13160 [Moorena producens 3L]NEP36598.1 hypothetical protein [Moorena sp. SIO3B2]NEP68795.1 hypothetical protein [Moorena sp. SIO3A5]NEQ11938.1 hypothetical protein [Moorena sp. SIO4E2]
MKPEIQEIGNFIKLINSQPDIFSEQDRNELEAIITPLSNHDVEGLLDKIENWCKSNPVIDDALNVLVGSQPIREKGIGGTVATPEAKADYEKNVKEELLNALRKSSTEETEKPNTPKG